MRLSTTNCLFFMIDMQKKLIPSMYNSKQLCKKISTVNKATELLQIPVLVSQQYSRGLGLTDESVWVSNNFKVFEKTQFSVFTDEIEKEIKSLNKPVIIFYGIESHICVTQSALDAVEKGYTTIVIADAVSSRDENNIKYALNRLQKAGCLIMPLEMILVEIIKDAKHKNFKDISKLIK